MLQIKEKIKHKDVYQDTRGVTVQIFIMEGALLVNQRHHPNEAFRNFLQIMHQKVCSLVLRDLSRIKRSMIACHKPMHLRNIVIFSSMKHYEGMKLKVSENVEQDKLLGIIDSKQIVDKEQCIFKDNMGSDMVECLDKTFKMVNKKIKIQYMKIYLQNEQNNKI